MGRIGLFRIGGIPIYLDFLFVVLIALWSSGYWASGSSTGISAAFVLCAGVFISILLHELGHAWAGRIWGVHTREIELNGLGGICIFERSLPASVLARTVVSLAGPLANLILWQAFSWGSDWARGNGGGMLALVLGHLAMVNWLLLIFNLLPAFPLDGGKVVEAWLAPILGPAWSVRVVAVLGLAVAIWLVLHMWPSPWALVLGALLAWTNWQMLDSVGGFGRRR